MAPRVTVLMLTFNRPQYISRAIKSIQSQTIEDWELIVVHDGPNEQIAQILAGWQVQEPRLRYFRRREKGNIAQATNFGLGHARGRYVAILDDDDYWSCPDKLERQIQFLESHTDHVACGGGVITVNEQGEETLRYLKPEHHDDIVRVALLANPMAHSTTLYRLDAAHKVGLYDEGLAGFQDWEFFLKLGRVGKLYNFQEHLLYYQIWQGGGSFQAQPSNTRSAITIVRRHGRYYRGYPAAITMASLYFLYARLPLPVKAASFDTFSRLKKAIFAAREPVSK